MSYKFRATKTDKQASKEIFLSPGINSFCVDKFGTYDISFEGCHTYDSTSPISFKTGDGNSIAVKAIKHRNGVRILADTKSTFKVLIENEKKEKNYVNFKEEPTKVNGYFAYRQDFDLKPYEKLIISPQSDTDLFSPASKEVSGANDCVEVRIKLNLLENESWKIPIPNITHCIDLINVFILFYYPECVNFLCNKGSDY